MCAGFMLSSSAVVERRKVRNAGHICLLIGMYAVKCLGVPDVYVNTVQSGNGKGE